MATARLIVRDYTGCRNKDGSSLIFVQYCHNYKAAVFSTGVKVQLNHFDSKKQIIKSTYPGSTQMNKLIHEFLGRFTEFIYQARINKIEPSVDYVKMMIRGEKREKVKNPAFMDFIKIYISIIKKRMGEATIRAYNNLNNHLKDFMVYNLSILTQGFIQKFNLEAFFLTFFGARLFFILTFVWNQL